MPHHHLAPTVARRTPRARVVLAVILAGALLLSFASIVSPPTADAATQTQTDMLNAVNAFRAANGVAPLTMCETLNTSAQAHAADMAARNYFEHVNPEGLGPADRAMAAGYGSTFVGENLATATNGLTTVSAVMTAWQGSPGHRANMLNASYTHLGTGVATRVGGVIYWVQNFGANGNCGSQFTGNFESISPTWFETARLTGWVFDATQPGSSINVDVYVDGSFGGRFPANKNRTDIAGAYPQAGGLHGFDLTINAAAGTHSVCVYAIGSNTNGVIGCKTVTLASGSPIGSVDTGTSPTPGRVQVTGWGIDPEVTSPITVHVYVDNQLRTTATANTGRGDIGQLYPGYGAAHGFDVTTTTGGGSHQVCVYGINQLVGSNSTLGCRTVNVVTPDPFGNLETLSVTGPRAVLASGWALDQNTPTQPIDVDIYVDGAFGGRFKANGTRTDVGGAFPGTGTAHGFSAPLTIAPGAHTVCAYGINADIGVNTLLSCQPVTVPSNPTGSFDALTLAGGALTGSGWVIDPDTASSIAVHVYVDGAFRGSFNAAATRNDIAAAFPFFGPSHGFSFSVNATPGPHNVCVYGINSGAGTNALLSCRSV